MGAFWRYVMSLALHLAWHKAGKRGPVPPVRIGKGPVNLPIIGPWQMMIALWVLRKFWESYGNDVKSRVDRLDHPLARKLNDLIPAPQGGKKGSGAASSVRGGTTYTVPNVTGSGGASAGSAGPVMGGATPAAATASPAPSPAPTRSYDTQPLGTGKLPAGSIISKLRGRSS